MTMKVSQEAGLKSCFAEIFVRFETGLLLPFAVVKIYENES